MMNDTLSLTQDIVDMLKGVDYSCDVQFSLQEKTLSGGEKIYPIMVNIDGTNIFAFTVRSSAGVDMYECTVSTFKYRDVPTQVNGVTVNMPGVDMGSTEMKEIYDFSSNEDELAGFIEVYLINNIVILGNAIKLEKMIADRYSASVPISIVLRAGNGRYDGQATLTVGRPAHGSKTVRGGKTRLDCGEIKFAIDSTTVSASAGGMVLYPEVEMNEYALDNMLDDTDKISPILDTVAGGNVYTIVSTSDVRKRNSTITIENTKPYRSPETVRDTLAQSDKYTTDDDSIKRLIMDSLAQSFGEMLNHLNIDVTRNNTIDGSPVYICTVTDAGKRIANIIVKGDSIQDGCARNCMVVSSNGQVANNVEFSGNRLPSNVTSIFRPYMKSDDNDYFAQKSNIGGNRAGSLGKHGPLDYMVDPVVEKIDYLKEEDGKYKPKTITVDEPSIEDSVAELENPEVDVPGVRHSTIPSSGTPRAFAERHGDIPDIRLANKFIERLKEFYDANRVGSNGNAPRINDKNTIKLVATPIQDKPGSIEMVTTDANGDNPRSIGVITGSYTGDNMVKYTYTMKRGREYVTVLPLSSASDMLPSTKSITTSDVYKAMVRYQPKLGVTKKINVEVELAQRAVTESDIDSCITDMADALKKDNAATIAVSEVMKRFNAEQASMRKDMNVKVENRQVPVRVKISLRRMGDHAFDVDATHTSPNGSVIPHTGNKTITLGHVESAGDGKYSVRLLDGSRTAFTVGIEGIDSSVVYRLAEQTKAWFTGPERTDTTYRLSGFVEFEPVDYKTTPAPSNRAIETDIPVIDGEV